MKNSGKRYISALLALSFLVAATPAQTGAAGSAKGSAAYGKTFEAAGSSAAAGRVRQGISQALRRAAERRRANAAKSMTTARVPAPKTNKPSRDIVSALPPPAASPTFFKPDPAADTIATLANELGTTTEERAILRELFNTTKTAFEEEVAAKGRRNNVAAAFTFFTAVNSMVYHGDPEPSDEAIDTLWDGLDSVFAEMPEFREMPDRDKQAIYDTLIAFSGLVLAGYMHAKETGDAATEKLYREVAGTMIRSVLKTEPEAIRFGTDGLVIN